MAERRKAKRRRCKANMYFPAMNHQGKFIMSERRHLSTRRVYDVFIDDIDLPTMFLDSVRN